MDGVLNVYKTEGPTSHDVVGEVRRLLGQKRVGHAGTLDPMATGVLVVCVGKATRIVEYLVGTTKEYRARLVLGQSTDTQDSSGRVKSEHDASLVTRDALEDTAAHFVGSIEQIPPMISAIKHQGRPLYKLARQGETVERQPRKVDVHSIEVLDFQPGPRAEAGIAVRCGSGTYIRTLCSDIGDMLGCGAHMSALERTAVGRFLARDAITTAQLAEAKDEGRLDSYVTSMADALVDLPAVVVDDEGAWKIAHGLPVGLSESAEPAGAVRILTRSGDLLALGTADPDERIAKPRKVLLETSLP